MNIDELKSQLEDVRAQMRAKDRNNPQQAQEYVELKKQEGDLIEQITAAQKEQTIEQKREELQEFVVSHDYNSVLGHPKANAIIHTLLGDQAEEYETRIAELSAKLEAVTKQGLEAEDKAKEANELLTEALIENTKLLEEKEELTAANEQLLSDNQSLRAQLAEQKDEGEEVAKLKEKLEEENKEARFYRNETARLTMRLQNVETELDYLKKQKEQLKPNQKLDDLLKEAQEFTNTKKQLKNIEQVDKNTYKGVDAEGREVTFPWYAKNAYEEVDTFPVPEVGDYSQEAAVEDQSLVTFQEDELHGVQSDDGTETIGGEGSDAANVAEEPQRWHQWADEAIRDLQRRVQGLEHGQGVNKAS